MGAARFESSIGEGGGEIAETAEIGVVADAGGEIGRIGDAEIGEIDIDSQVGRIDLQGVIGQVGEIHIDSEVGRVDVTGVIGRVGEIAIESEVGEVARVAQVGEVAHVGEVGQVAEIAQVGEISEESGVVGEIARVGPVIGQVGEIAISEEPPAPEQVTRSHAALAVADSDGAYPSADELLDFVSLKLAEAKG